MPKGDRKTINFVEVKPHIFEWLKSDANTIGEKMSKYIGDVLEALYYMGEGKVSVSAMLKNNPSSKIVLIHQDMERNIHKRNLVRHMGALYVENPSESNAEKLQEACDNIGLPYDEVIRVATADPFSSIVAQTMGKSKIDECVFWVIDTFKKYGKLESNDFNTMASKAGYNNKMTWRARKILLEDPDTPYIDVERDGNIWWYIIKDKNGNFIEPTEPESLYEPEQIKYPKAIKAFLNTGEPLTIVLDDNEDNYFVAE